MSIYRIGADGVRDVFVTGLTNATSMAFDPQGRLHVSSRFDGTVSRIDAQGRAEIIATELGVATGLAFDPDGVLYVGDRSGTIFRLSHSGHATPFASLPPSVAAYHLAWHPRRRALRHRADDLDARRVYRIGRQGDIRTVYEGFGRPQGLAVDTDGSVLVAEALAGASGIYRVRPGQGEPASAEPESGRVGPCIGGRGRASRPRLRRGHCRGALPLRLTGDQLPVAAFSCSHATWPGSPALSSIVNRNRRQASFPPKNDGSGRSASCGDRAAAARTLGSS